MLRQSLVRLAFDKLLGRVLNFLVPKLVPGALITNNDQPYLHRYYPHEDNDGFGWYLHKFVDSDEPDVVHNHPWVWCYSVILTCGYFEVRYKSSDVPSEDEPLALFDRRELFHRPLSVNVIRHDDFHRVTLIGNRPVWTLFVHGPRVRKWGKVNEETGIYKEVVGLTRHKIGNVDA